MTKIEREKVWTTINELSEIRNEYKEAGELELESRAYAELQGAIKVAIALDVVEIKYREK